MNRGYTGKPEPYSDFRERRLAQEAEEVRQRQHLERENQRARLARSAQLDAERAAQREQAAERLEAALGPAKERLRRAWLIEHPDQDAAAFERRAWPLLKKSLLKDRAAEQERAFRAGAGGVRYSL
jgi:hypothetical protein